MKNYLDGKNIDAIGAINQSTERVFNLLSTLGDNHTSSNFSKYETSNDVFDDNEQDDDALIEFNSEDEQEDITPLTPWKILIADDDANVHDTTVLALTGVLVHGRPLEFFHAYSAQGAHTLVDNHPDAAILLLDVVMESADAGLKLVPILRNELGRHSLRIIMRTGQPGYAKDRIMEDYNIDGYTSKSQLTRTILIKIIHDALEKTINPTNGKH